VEYFANGLLHQPEETFRHEIVHAVMRLDLGREPYRKLPKWLREGVAVHVARQTAGKLTQSLMQRRFALEPEKLIDGLEDKEHDLDDYTEDALGVAYLLRSAGSDALLKLGAELRNGKDYREAIAAVANQAFPKFVAGAREFSLAILKEETGKLRKELDLYRVILEKNDQSKAECDSYLASFPESPLRSAVLYYAAKSAGDEALPAFDAFIESALKPDGYPAMIDDAMMLKARQLVKKGRTSEAFDVYSDLVKWHVGSPHAVTALYEWGVELFPTARDKAMPLLHRALEIAPRHALAERAKKLLKG
jgi:tetratricopeptide (TPR) repeat protein